MNTVQLIILILVLHFISDFNLQIGAGLHETKQKEWWTRMFKDHGIIDNKRYRNDWLVCLLIHSFVWTVVTFAPLIWLHGNEFTTYIVLTFEFVIHAMVDHVKANDKIINLAQDQMFHLVQIAIGIMKILSQG